MLLSTPSAEQVALSRLTFGAHSADVAYVQKFGLDAWTEEQLGAPAGDDPSVAAHLASQTMPIKYAAATSENVHGTWGAVDEVRPLNYLNAPIATLWNISQQANRSISPAERTRVLQEVMAATWIRNVQSQYQLREFMTDFWHNHFNIGKTANLPADAPLATYDRDVIRPNVFGNFRTLLEADASSTSMLLYLNNADSNAATPNENYGRELLELHTLSAAVYLGIDPPGGDNNGAGYTDNDVVQASLALSGWSINMGQQGTGRTRLPDTGDFVYNPVQHNNGAAVFLGTDLSKISGNQAQGSKVLDLAAYHSSTATFICTKLCRRIFGDTPPPAVINRAVAAWMANATQPDQIAQVLKAIILGGSEISATPQVKIRRPYERVMALLRTTGTVVNASPLQLSTFDPVNDGLFAWATPDGRPDVNSYWLATGATLTAWNLAHHIPAWSTMTTSLTSQTPTSVLSSPTAVVEYWVGQMVGFALAPEAMNGLVADQSSPNGIPAAAMTGNSANIESAAIRLVGLIAMTNEFSYR